ncbi:hypothetical protein [Marinivivus vitaminiproducens]|uniref:hypothetical protein n=1 Tax=Marinivivus vitaminiproducens TaxID=3035935 RepID=UPI00279CDADE|nr:hypothetical protein P4R82_05315 [Geminicoccaceae bacterium SCSIO 64248]
MAPRINPLGLNKLQLKTLLLFQAVAREEDMAQPEGEGVRVTNLPDAHGDHFHLGRAVVRAADATGLTNAAVWTALARKGLIEGSYPDSLLLTKAGLDYDTASAGPILHHADH